jgi:hypothetical protein
VGKLLEVPGAVVPIDFMNEYLEKMSRRISAHV